MSKHQMLKVGDKIKLLDPAYMCMGKHKPGDIVVISAISERSDHYYLKDSQYVIDFDWMGKYAEAVIDSDVKKGVDNKLGWGF